MDEVDTVFFRARKGKIHSWLIGLFTYSTQHKNQYSHVEIQVSPRICLGSDEADGGVRAKEGIDTHNGCWDRLTVPVPNLAAGMDFFRGTDGAGYDFARIGMAITKPFRKLFHYGKSRIFKDNKKKWICNEWAYAFLVACGCELPPVDEVSNPNEFYDIVRAYILKQSQVNP